LVDRAFSGSPTLGDAIARMHEAQAQLATSRTGLFPQLTFDLNEQRLRFSENYIIPPPFGGTWQWYGTAQANLSWSLDLFGKLRAEVQKARFTAKAAALDATAARLALAGAVVNAYVGLQRAHLLDDVAAEAVRQRESVYTLTTGRVQAGLDDRSSQKIAEAQLANARQDQLRTAATCELAVHQIAALIGRGADAYALERPRLNQAALALPDTLPADLLGRRADVAAALARIDAATAGRKAARRAFYPDINLAGAAGWAAIGLSPLFSGSSAQYGAGPAIHLPLFDAGTLRANYAGATASLDQSIADYNQAVVTAVKETADALSELHMVQAQAVEQRHAFDAAKESFALAERRYRSGLSPQLNVLTAEDLLIQTRRQDAALAADTISARINLLLALGGGFAPEKMISAERSAPQEEHHHE
jgi:NodT family efflux transporter outer membrane factor (OMF) lipoprotein